MHYIFLFIAILAEVVATSALKATDGFTRVTPSILVFVGYSLSFYCLSLTLRQIPIGVAYAIWSGIGIALVTLIGYVLYQQRLELPVYLGLLLIIAGVVVIQVFSTPAG